METQPLISDGLAQCTYFKSIPSQMKLNVDITDPCVSAQNNRFALTVA